MTDFSRASWPSDAGEVRALVMDAHVNERITAFTAAAPAPHVVSVQTGAQETIVK